MVGTKRQNIDASSTQDYRQISGLNYSMIKKFDDDPMVFFSEFILGNPRVEKETNSLLIGQLVDFLMLDCGGDEEEFDQRMHEKFGLFGGVKSTAQAFDLADEIFRLTVLSRNENGEVGREFIDCFKEAFSTLQSKGKYKSKKWEDGLNDYNEKAKGYYDTKIANFGKIVVDLWQVEKAKSLASQARGDEFHGELVNMQTGGDVEVIDKLAIEFAYRGWNCKMEQDRTIIDHEQKIIRRLDYKTAYDNESFDYSYLKRKYYLQNSFYYKGTAEWAARNNLKNYAIGAMEFLVFDTSINNRRPLKYNTNHNMVQEGLDGFTLRGKQYKGIDQLLDEIMWAKENGIWSISKTNYLNRGTINMKTFNVDELQPED